MKRQRGRNRGSGGNSGKPQHNTNRAFDSNGPDGVKVRGAAQSVYEKYQQLARDAHTSGDRVLAENYLQHAEHYFRVMRAMQPQRPISEIIGRDQFVSGYDIDFEDESGQAEAVEGDELQAAESVDQSERFDARRDDRSRDDYRPREDYRPRDEQRYSDTRQRDERQREDRYQGDRGQNERSQNDRAQNDRGQNDRVQNDRGQNDRVQSDRAQPERYAGDRPAAERQPSDRQASDRQPSDRPPSDRPPSDRSNRTYRGDRPRYDRDERSRADASEVMPVVEPEATPLPVERPASVLRADDGEISHAPAFLQVRPVEPRDEAAPAVRKAPRRRTPRAFENTDAAAAEAPAKSGAEEG